MKPQPPVILDFVHGTVVTAGSSEAADQQYREFLKLQQQQLTSQGHPPKV